MGHLNQHSGVALEVTVSAAGGGEATTLLLRGELDLASTAVLEQTVDELLAMGCNRICADLSALTFCDSVGLNGLVRAKNRCHERGGWFAVSRPHGEVAQVIDISGLLDSFSANS